MLISGLKLAGFKSFADPTELTIAPGLTGVVGPNGCGKSNVVDAIRWVMGESSARGLRGQEMDDVIFAGSDARPAFDFAEVALQLEPRLTEGGDRLDVVRRLGRGVGSTFRVNGKEARAKDISRMLADAAAGARSAAIVGQGHIGALVEARPHERQRLLAEAAGIAGLQSRRREAELRLEAVQANLATVGERRTQLEEMARKLEKQAREAAKFKLLNSRHRELQVLLLLARVRQAQARLEAAELETQAAVEHERSAVPAQREAASASAQARSRLDELLAAEREQAGTYAGLAERRAAREQAAAEARAAMERLAAEADQLSQDIDREEATALRASAALRELEAAEAEAPTALAGLTQALAAATNDAAEAQTAAAAAEAQWRDAMAAADAARAAEERLRQELATGRADLAQLEGEQATVSRELAERQADAAEATSFVDQEALVAETRAALVQLEQRLAAAEQQVVDADAAREAAAEAARRTTMEAASVESRLQTQRQALADGQARLADLEARLNVASDRLASVSAEEADHRAAYQQLDLQQLRRRVDDATAALDQETAKVTAAAEVAQERDAALTAAKAQLTELAMALARLEAERDALGAAQADEVASGMPAAAAIVVPPHLVVPLAAILGDDLAASLDPDEAWAWSDRGLPAAANALPPDAQAFTELLDVPGPLRARLALSGLVADMATAARLAAELAPGQRLTTPQGGLWRWDGLVREPGVAAPADGRAAARLRLTQINADLAATTARHAGLTQVVADHAELFDAATAEVERLEAVARAVAAEAQRARDALAVAERTAAALDAKLAAVSAERARLEPEIERLRGQMAADAELPAAGYLDHLDAEVRARRQEAEQAASALAERKNSAAAAREGLQELRQRRAQAQSGLDEALTRLEQSRAAKAAQDRETAAARARLEERAASLAKRAAEQDHHTRAVAEQLTGVAAAAAASAEALQHAQAARATTGARRDDAAAALLNAQSQLDGEERERSRRRADISQWRERLGQSRTALTDLATRRQRLAAHQEDVLDRPARLAGELAELREQAATLEGEIVRLRRDREAAAEACANAERQHREADAKAAAAAERQQGLILRRDAAQAALEGARDAARQRLHGDPSTLLEDPEIAKEVAAADPDKVETELARLEAGRDRLGAVNLRADEELTEVREEAESLGDQAADLEAAVAKLRRAIAELNGEGRDRLLRAFQAVEQHFHGLFRRLFGGGKAALTLAEDPNDPLGAGLDLAASPPGKRMQALSLLSGGEKALTAVALIFAFFRTQPAPLCVLDEVDAPLDDANVARLGELMAEVAVETGTRFLVVTHHPLTMARMDRLYGVTMLERGLSALVSVQLEEAVALRESA